MSDKEVVMPSQVLLDQEETALSPPGLAFTSDGKKLKSVRLLVPGPLSAPKSESDREGPSKWVSRGSVVTINLNPSSLEPANTRDLEPEAARLEPSATEELPASARLQEDQQL